MPAGAPAASLLCLALSVAATAAAANEQCRGESTRINTVVEGLRSTRGNIVVEI